MDYYSVPNKNSINPMRSRGFTLVEMAVVLVIAGALLSAGLKLLGIQTERAAISVTQKHQEAIKQALITYLGRMGRLPCPDLTLPPDGLDLNDRTAAGACAAYSGRVPFVELGLDRDAVLDGWDNYIDYVVSPTWQLTYNPSAPLSSTQTPVRNDAFWPGIRIGNISVWDRNPPAAPVQVGDPVLGTGAAVALISHGRNGAGALNTSNQPNDPPPAGTDELSNVGPALPGLLIYKRQFLDRDLAGGTYDDVVVTMSASDFISPLVNSGAFQSATPSAVLQEANDNVISQIISTKTICGAAPPAAVVGCPPANYYYIVPSLNGLVINGPENALAWNATYVGGAGITYIYNASPDFEAYRITINNGLPRIMRSTELKSILAHAAGF